MRKEMGQNFVETRKEEVKNNKTLETAGLYNIKRIDTQI